MPRVARRPTREITGCTARPDVDRELIEELSDAVLERGFQLEDVRVAEPVSLAAVEAPYGSMVRVALDGVTLTGAHLRGVRLGDVSVGRADAAGLNLTQASANRVVFADCRMTGVELAEADLRETVFRDCKLDYANFRMATLADATFENCVLVDADFGGAKLDNVRFDGCELREVEFANARMRDVDLRGCDLSVRGSATALRGAVVSPLQLMELAPVLAHEAGIRVEE